MKKYTKILFVVLCAFLCASILLSAVYLVHASAHECEGENCEICNAITLHKDTLTVVCLCYGTIVFALQLLQSAFYINNLTGISNKDSSLIAEKVKISC